jgi:hypothetical protein
VLNRFLTAWAPNLIVKTHTVTCTQYAYALTLIPTQPYKPGVGLGDFLCEHMLPVMYDELT